MLGIGSPYNVQHNVHVNFNTTTGFEGLPPDWEAMLKTSGITKDDVMQNSDAVLEILEFQSAYNKNLAAGKPHAGIKKNPPVATLPASPPAQQVNRTPPPNRALPGTRPGSDAPTPPPPAPSSDGDLPELPAVPLPEDRMLSLSDLVSKENPELIYCDYKKVGEGYVGRNQW